MSLIQKITLLISLITVLGVPQMQAAIVQEQEAQDVSQAVLLEFDRLRKMTQDLEPDFDIAGYMFGKKYSGGVELLWRTTPEADIIRIYYSHGEDEEAFVVAYHRGRHLISERNVVRRFIGPNLTGWRNDTIDFETGEFLGSQGLRSPLMTAEDLEVLKNWGITLFD